MVGRGVENCQTSFRDVPFLNHHFLKMCPIFVGPASCPFKKCKNFLRNKAYNWRAGTYKDWRFSTNFFGRYIIAQFYLQSRGGDILFPLIKFVLSMFKNCLFTILFTHIFRRITVLEYVKIPKLSSIKYLYLK